MEVIVKELSTLEQGMLYGVIATAIIGLLYALWLWRDTCLLYTSPSPRDS